MGNIDRPSPLFLFLVCGLVLGLTGGSYHDAQARFNNMTEQELKAAVNLWAQHGPNYDAYSKTKNPFPCEPLPKSASIPTSVHKLRPGDVNVIGAMGDSLTAGQAMRATTLLGVFIQYRGLSWSGGGGTNYEDQITLPNILKKYNPDLYGFATGIGDENSEESVFNVAVSGSTCSNLVAQANMLVQRMKTDPKVDVNKDWKVVTILTGNNDLCDYCDDKVTYSVDRFRDGLVAALDILHAELPRTLVNLVEPLNVDILAELNKGLLCSTIHMFHCACAAYPDSKDKEAELRSQARLYQAAVEDISLSGRYDSTEDFTVVYQPFLNGTYVPKREDGQPDMSYYAPDCFHLSEKGQANAAAALWNNMIEPVGQKTTDWLLGENLECPTEDQPYFFTNKNSDLPSQEKGTSSSNSDSAGSSATSVVGAVIGVLAIVVVGTGIVVVLRQRRRRHSYDNI